MGRRNLSSTAPLWVLALTVQLASLGCSTDEPKPSGSTSNGGSTAGGSAAPAGSSGSTNAGTTGGPTGSITSAPNSTELSDLYGTPSGNSADSDINGVGSSSSSSSSMDSMYGDHGASAFYGNK